MASITKRRNADGSTSWDVLVRVVGYRAKGRTFRTKLAAELWAARTETRAKGGAMAQAKGMTFGMLLDEALPRLKNPTKAVFDYWRSHVGDLRLEKITPELIADHRDRLLGAECRGYKHKRVKARSSATVRNYLIELSRLCELAVKELRVMDSNPCRKVKKPAASREIVRWLSDDERTALLKACKESRDKDLYPFVLFALTTGARKGEVEALEWANVDIGRRWATFPKTKNGSARGVPLTNAVAAILAARERTEGRVFPVDITKAWHGAIARAGVQNFRFHDLRHSCGSAMVQNGANLAEVATLLGHKSLQMTLRYSHVGNAGTTSLVDRVMGGIA